jgi:hypothetical protein
MAKRVPEEERIAVAQELKQLLSTESGREGEPETFRRLWTQASLGKACGVSQETLRRALEPSGVTPAVCAGLLKLKECSMDELLERHRGYLDHLRRINPKRQAILQNATKDRAIEILVRANWPLTQSQKAVSAASMYTIGEEDEPSAERWAKLGAGILAADERALRADEDQAVHSVDERDRITIDGGIYVAGSPEAEAARLAMRAKIKAQQEKVRENARIHGIVKIDGIRYVAGSPEAEEAARNIKKSIEFVVPGAVLSKKKPVRDAG